MATIHPSLRLTRLQATDALNALYILRKNQCRVAFTELAKEYVSSGVSSPAGGGAITLLALCRRFFKTLPPEQERNRGSYRSMFRHLFSVLDKRMRVSMLNEAHILSVLAPYKHPVSYTSVLRRVSTVLNWGVGNRLMKCNPAAKIKTRPAVYQEPSFFGTEKVEAVFSAARVHGSQEIHIFLILGFYVGLRTAEILRTQWRDIHEEEGFVRVSRPKGITCGVKPRIVELEAKTVALLRACRAMGVEHREACQENAEADARSDCVVSSIWRVSQWKKSYLEPHGISWGNDSHHNVMRHTYATMHVAAFRNAAATALNLGHAEGSGILDKHYRGLVNQAEALRYWKA